MLISEFSRITELSVDTVRFYIRKGLIKPHITAKGGSKPYQLFKPEHIEIVRMVRIAQALGFSIKEISSLNTEYNTAALDPSRSIEIMKVQISKLEEKEKQLSKMTKYLRAKIAWLQKNRVGPEPRLGR